MLGHTLQFHQDLPEPALSIYQTAIRLLTCILYNKLVNGSINISLSSVRFFSKLIEPKREACGNLPSTVSSSEAQATTWPPDWLLKGAGVGGYSCGTETLASGI